MNPFPGQAPLTVHLTGPSGPGLIVSAGGADPTGSWPTPIEATGNDARTAANLMAAAEALTDRTNWIGWRTPDWIAGGDYRALYQTQVEMATALVLDRSGFGDLLYTLTLVGNNNSMPALVASAFSGDIAAAFFNGHGRGGGIVVTSGHTSGAASAVIGQGYAGSNANGVEGVGDGSGVGVKGTAGANQLAAVWAHNGCVNIDTSLPSHTQDPGANNIWADQIAKAGGWVKTGASLTQFGFNFTASIVNTPLGTNTGLKITFTRPMVDANYACPRSVDTPTVGPGGTRPHIWISDDGAGNLTQYATDITFIVLEESASWNAQDLTTHSYVITFDITGRM